MTDNYGKIVQNNLDKLYSSSLQDLATHLPALQEGERFIFEAFGETCVMGPGGIALGKADYPSVTCLYSHNADQFMPVDGLADTGEYTSKKILDLAGA